MQKSYLRVCPLEVREVPAVFTVINVNDAGAGSLREAVSKANTQPGADTIVFDAKLANKTIILTTDDTNPATTKNGKCIFGLTGLVITSEVTIDGTAAVGLKISGDDERRHFVVAGKDALTPVTGASLTLKSINLSAGLSRGGDGSGGGAGLGGSIFVDQGGKLSTDNATFSRNNAVGGKGGVGYVGGNLGSNFGGGTAGGRGASGGFGGGGGDGAGLGAVGGPGGAGGFGAGGGAGEGGGSAGSNGRGFNGGEGGSGGFGGGGGVGGPGGTGDDGDGRTGWGGNAGFGASSQGGGSGAGMGGAIFNYNGTVTLTNSKFLSNKTEGGNVGEPNQGEALGGAIFNLSGTVNISACVFSKSSADAGGAIYNAGVIGSFTSATMTITGTTIDGNKAKVGAAVFNGGKLNSPDSTLEGNEAALQGGAYFNAEGAELIIINDRMINNAAGRDGGGIVNYGTLTMSKAVLDDNDAIGRNGGGLANFGSAFVSDTKFMNNDAGLDGGAVANGTGAKLTLSGTSLFGNHAEHNGGAIYGRGSESLEEEQMVGNTAGNEQGGFYEAKIAGQPLDGDSGLFGDGNYDTGEPESVVGANAGGGPRVKFIKQDDNSTALDFFAYDPNFLGGVNVARGWVADSDGIPHEAIVTAAASNGGPHIKVFDAFSGRLLREFFAYDASFTGGVNLAVGDVNGDGLDDIITAAARNGGPHVKVFDGYTLGQIHSFFAYDPAFTGGVTVAAGDVNGDGLADIVTGTGEGGAPIVRVFEGLSGQPIRSFLAYGDSFRGGVNVAAGDLDADGKADIVTGAGFGGGSHVKKFDGATGAEEGGFMAFNADFRGGVHVAMTDANDDGILEILAGVARAGGSEVAAFDADDYSRDEDFFAFDPSFLGGVNIG